MKLQELTTPSFTVLADGLDNPKGLCFGPDGCLYVAEAGTGGNKGAIPSASGQGDLYYGTTGCITKIEHNRAKRILTGLPSVAFPDGTGAAGPHDIKFDASGLPYVLIGYAANPEFRRNLGDIDLGKIIIVNLDTNDWDVIADIAQYELTENPDDNEVVSNPLAFLIDTEQTLQKLVIVDAGANDILSVSTDISKINTTAVLPRQILNNPIFPGSSAHHFDKGHTPPPGTYRDATSPMTIAPVPTSIVKGPDKAYYVSTFTGFPFPEGGAKIYRIDVDGQITVFADGFTQLIDLAFDAEGDLYVLQHMNHSGWKGKQEGSLIRIASDGTRTTLWSGEGLEAPAALTIGADNAFYLINRGGKPGLGQVIRIEKISYSFN
jgi:hypothetical protein